MQRDYAGLTTSPIQILRHGTAMALPAEAVPGAEGVSGEWVIGFAGSMYSDCAWGALLAALDQSDWRLAGRPVRIKVLGARIALASRTAARVEFLGFRSPEQVQAILAQCHVNYMPQPFVPHLAELCRYAFPTKLTSYLATGRPVFVHAPQEGALSRFFEANPVGARATSLDPDRILEALEGLLGNEEAYREACRQASETARHHFDAGVFHRAIDELFETSTRAGPIAPSPVAGMAT
jgi:glycosyltransferase involved in cell wall biosynthesis